MSALVLIVDDEQPIREMISRFINSQGHTALEAESAEQALAVLKEIFVDVVITDLKMPGMNGLELGQKLLEQDPERPVLLMTAYADLDSARRAVQIGFYEYFIKPFDMEDVSAALERALEHRRLVLEVRAYQRNLEQKVQERTRELRQTYEELIQNEKFSAVGRLAAGVMHEVINLLSVATGQIDTVRLDRALRAKYRESLQTAKEQIDRAVQMVLNLRHFSEQRSQERVRVNINRLITQALDLVSHETKQQAIETVTRLDSLPDVQGDPDQLSQLFLHLIDNAIKAMPDGGRLTIRTSLEETQGGAVVEARISDTGTGIAESDLPRIFTPFFTTRKYSAGLGLAICRGITEVHGGQIETKSGSDGGAEFILRLPVSHAPASSGRINL